MPNKKIEEFKAKSFQEQLKFVNENYPECKNLSEFSQKYFGAKVSFLSKIFNPHGYFADVKKKQYVYIDNSLKTGEVVVQVDLGINPHDVLDYELEYKPYLETIKTLFSGYISYHHFVQVFAVMFGEKERKLERLIAKLVDDNWLGSVTISSRYKFLYLKRKSTICLSKKKNNSDLKPPTTRQVVRSLLLAETCLKYNRFDFKQLENDVFYLGGFVVVFDLTKRSSKDYKDLIEDLLYSVALKDYEKANFLFLTYSEGRKKVLLKVLKDDQVQAVKTVQFTYNKQAVHYKSEIVDIMKFFDGKEPLI